REIFHMLEGLPHIVIVNKSDLSNRLDINEVRSLAGEQHVIEMAVIAEEGIDRLEDALSDLFMKESLSAGDMTYVSNVRHIQLLKEAKRTLEDAQEALQMQMPLDMIQIDVTRTWELLGEIIGDTASESLIDQLFSQFCLGK